MPGVKAFLTKLLHKKIDHTGLPGVDVHSHDDQYFRENEHLDAFDGSAGAPVKTDAGGKIDPGLIDIAAKTRAGCTFVLQEQDTVIVVGTRTLVYIEQPFVIDTIKFNADVPGSLALDLWWEPDAVNGGVPTIGDSIVGANPPTWTTKQYDQWTDFSGWVTTDITKGGWLMLNLTSTTDFKYLQIHIAGNVYTGA